MREHSSEEYQRHRNRGISLPYLRELRQSRGLSQRELGEQARSLPAPSIASRTDYGVHTRAR